MKDLEEAGPAFEPSESTSNGTPLDRQVYQTLFRDNSDEEGSTIAPRFILRMRVERGELSFWSIRFEFKAQRYQAFDKWDGQVLARPGLKNLFNQLGIMNRSFKQGRSLWRGIHLTSSFSFHDGARRPIPLWVSRLVLHVV